MKISGVAWHTRASSTASIQNAVSIVIKSRHASTFLLNQSMTAVRKTKPLDIGM